MNTTNILNQTLRKTADFIANVQDDSGAIAWFEGGIVDPWDHVEAVMGLTVAGKHREARAGLDWLQRTQTNSGMWYAAYRGLDVADDQRAETNFVAYPATGVWHYYLATQDANALRTYWPMVEAALDWVLQLQTEHGEVYWAVDKDKGVSRDALMTGCSSIFKSLECAARICQVLGLPADRYLLARKRLGEAIVHKPERFDRTWESKARYSMDWFYPVLTGAMQGDLARQRLNARWDEFVIPDLGCKCVQEEPWVTMAETCELVMACVAADDHTTAAQLLQWQYQHQVEDGSWWTGYVYTDEVYWPDERPTWTAGAILLAADAVYRHSPACYIFNDHLPPTADAVSPTS